MPDKAPLSFAFNLPFEEAIQAAQARGVLLPEAYYALPAEKRQYSQTISGLSQLDQIQAVHDKLTAYLQSGKTFNDFRREVGAMDFGLSPGRLDLVFRNAVQNAYNAGHWRNFEQHKARRPYLMYDAVNDSRTRPAHRAMDGIIKPVDDPFWLTHSPSCGHRCRCKLISLSADEITRRGGVTGEIPAGARADEGWGYKPAGQGEMLGKIEADKLAKASPVVAAAYNARMKRLPNYKNAVIDDAKLVSYALNIDHPIGGHKARRIRAALGFDASHKEVIIEAIRRAIITNPAIEGKAIQWGRVFTVDFLLTGKTGEAIVRTSWIIENESDAPRMTSFYVKES